MTLAIRIREIVKDFTSTNVRSQTLNLVERMLTEYSMILFYKSHLHGAQDLVEDVDVQHFVFAQQLLEGAQAGPALGPR
jgi:hypothetical protein